MPPSIFDAPLYAFVVVLGIGLIVLARWAARRKGTRWESLVALRVGDRVIWECGGYVAPVQKEIAQPAVLLTTAAFAPINPTFAPKGK